MRTRFASGAPSLFRGRFLSGRHALRVASALLLGALAIQGWAASIVITEFFNKQLGHYVLITSPDEVAAIENGAAGPGWQRTGRSLNASSSPTDAADLVPVCRFYGSISPGPNSHFFTADPDECASVKTDPGWHFEGIAFHVALPVAGECGPGQAPVWRAYNNGFKPDLGINDGNHRFSVDQPSIQKLVDSGWNDEGVVFCAQADTPSVPVRLGVPSSSLLLLPGTSRNVFVTVEPRNGFAGVVSLTAEGLLPGVSFEFSPATVTLGADATDVVLKLTVAPSVQPTAGTDILLIKSATATAGSSTAGIPHRIAEPGDPAAARLAAIAAVEEQCRELSAQGLTPLAFVQAVSTFMSGRPEYAATGVDAETLSAWGRFKDGHIHVVTNGYEPTRTATASAIVDRRTRDKSAGAELPARTKARLLQSFGPAAIEQRPIDDMSGFFRAKNWAVPAGASDAHVGTLKGSVGDGFFYLNTHAGRYEVPDPSEPGGMMYAIQSSTLVDDQYDAIFADDLKTLRLVHQTANNFNPVTLLGFVVKQRYSTKYGITYRFVDKYMSFANSSVVLINACWSGRYSEFRNAFIRKGAGVYLGWSDILDAFTVSRSAPYFVDRMLGANRYSADKESPPQRPFPYHLVLADMDKKSLLTVAQTGAKLFATEATGLKYPPIFAPSIKSVRVNEYDEELTLDGEFGEDKPNVSVGGAPRNVKSWTATKIVTDLSRAGDGSSGDVVVEVRGVRSNARQLTEWPLALDYNWSGVYGIAGLSMSGAHPIRFRADIGGYRDVPGEPPKYDILGGPPTQDSGLTVTASGSGTSGDCSVALSGAGTYVSPSSPAAQQGTVLASGIKIDAKAKTGLIGLSFGTFSSPHTMTISGPDTCNATIKVSVFMGLLGGFFDVPRSQLDPSQTINVSGAELTLDADYAINARQFIDESIGGEIRVSWPLVRAKTPPRDTIDAGK